MSDDAAVRTTLDLDEDVLQAAKELAAARGSTAGRVVSDLLRQALAPARHVRFRNGVPLLGAGRRRRPLTMAEVNRLRDE